MLNTEAWTEFLRMQGPAMQGLMGRYLEQSANAFLEMQQQLQQQTRNLFGNFPFPNFAAGYRPGPAAKPADEPKGDEPKSDSGSGKT
jgi:polyhydroxyalkanoate synthesis regulator protein